MKQILCAFAILVAVSLLFGCGQTTVSPTDPTNPTDPTDATVITDPTEPSSEPTEPSSEPTEPSSEPTEPSSEPTEPPKPEHSDLYIEGLAVEDVIRYFNEICLDAEFVTAGDPSKVQKWVQPIGYKIFGTPTDKDREVLDGFVAWLNTIEGFPGMKETNDAGEMNLRIYFYDRTAYNNLMGSNFAGTDGGVTFWYNGKNEIYNETIGYRTDIGQDVRNSVILEEIYNGLGPVQDTDLRKDSIIYSGYSIPQSLTAVDELLLKLLYHPDIKCGMNTAQCEEVIRRLYY